MWFQIDYILYTYELQKIAMQKFKKNNIAMQSKWLFMLFI